MFKRASLGVVRQSLGRRAFHDVPKMKDAEIFRQEGIKGLYSPAGFKSSWLDYQKYLTLNLTLLTNGTENELRSPYQIALQTAKNTNEQHTFHFASQAHNNHFFFEQLTNRDEALTTKPSRFILEKLADKDFLDLQSFKKEILSKAESFIGQGWVFLVELPDKSLKILKCNNDGTPYYYGKNQSLDLNGGIDEGTFDSLQRTKELAAEGSRDFTLPILAINVWDTAYITDYGVTGKAEYLEKLWDCINWNVVNKRLFQL